MLKKTAILVQGGFPKLRGNKFRSSCSLGICVNHQLVNAMLETSFTSSATVIFCSKQVAKYKNRIDSMQLN